VVFVNRAMAAFAMLVGTVEDGACMPLYTASFTGAGEVEFGPPPAASSSGDCHVWPYWINKASTVSCYVLLALCGCHAAGTTDMVQGSVEVGAGAVLAAAGDTDLDDE
jgi:hypothetical protein